jgi:hypothetical protein
MKKRIGFACKWIDRPDQVDGIKPKDDCKKYNTGSTTVAWLNRQTKDVAVEKLWSLMEQNIESCRKLVERVGELDEDLRMVRLGSDVLPVSQLGVGFGGLPMSEPIVKEHFGKWGIWLARVMLGSVFILVSLLCWLAIVRIL